MAPRDLLILSVDCNTAARPIKLTLSIITIPRRSEGAYSATAPTIRALPVSPLSQASAAAKLKSIDNIKLAAATGITIDATVASEAPFLPSPRSERAQRVRPSIIPKKPPKARNATSLVSEIFSSPASMFAFTSASPTAPSSAPPITESHTPMNIAIINIGPIAIR